MGIDLKPIGDEPIKPLKVFTTRQIPLHLKSRADKLIDELLTAKVIIPEREPTDWVAPAHFVPKPNSNKVRLVTDYRVLNKYISRPIHPFPAANELIRKILPDSKVFCKIDCIHGYYQVPLDEEASKLTTFLLPSGRYRYMAAPMGLSQSSDYFCQKTDEVFRGLDGWFLKIVDDGLIQAPDEDTLLERVQVVLQRCREAGIKVSKSKFVWGKRIKFAGYIVSDEGVSPDPDKVAGISKFPIPKSVSELRSFLGLANQLGMFIPDLSQMTVKMRQLLKKNVAFVWVSEHDEEFAKVKSVLCSDLIVKPFDTSLPTLLLTDASRLFGIGYALIQKDGESIRLIDCSSVSLNDAQRNYATIELECLAIKWAVLRCEYYLRGIKHFEVISDHRPLVGIFNKPLQDLGNQRLANFREKLVDFNFSVTWTEGKSHLIADALSRAPVFSNNDLEEVFVQAVDVSDTSTLQFLPDLAEEDELYQQLIGCWKSNGNPKQFAHLTPYAGIWDRLSLGNHGLLVLDGQRILIPPSAYDQILKLLHIPHTGMVKTKANAQQLYYWPGMCNDITQIVQNCRICQEHLPSLPREPILWQSCDEPMECVSLDLFDLQGQTWLIMVDRFSGFPFAQRMFSLTTEKVVDVLMAWFADWGMPGCIKSDNGPQFRDKFTTFCNEWDITHDTSSPYNPASNGLAEAAVKNVKFLLRKCLAEGSNFRLALLEWRNCPRADGFSPAQAFLGRRQKSRLPMMQPGFDEKSFVDSREELRHKVSEATGFSTLSSLEIGDKVLVQDQTGRWTRPGEITEVCGATGRSFLIRLEDGKSVRRNRRFIRIFSSNCEESTFATATVSILKSSKKLQEQKVSFAQPLCLIYA